ncbi:GDSL-type esterase/lipase family protein [Hanstruepera ponticola]|uniref:GDSL-type esterase/lipase family protein n=1 Tax=Hanstruepera ponticola TaxID=2042995 RepID=UPI00178623FD|nr:GDSL-type esterase/lipase family protein [Hanstruepera ponticola]
MKIVCLGDSLTETYGIDQKKGWVNLLRKELNAETINAGICGDTTNGMLARCEQLIFKHKPSHLIILGGTNDLWYGLKKAYIISNLQAITSQAKYHEVVPVIGLPTLSYNLEELNTAQENYSESINSFRKALLQYCINQDKICIDFSKNMEKEHFLEDGLHPNELGQKIMFQNALTVLKMIK